MVEIGTSLLRHIFVIRLFVIVRFCNKLIESFKKGSYSLYFFFFSSESSPDNLRPLEYAIVCEKKRKRENRILIILLRKSMKFCVKGDRNSALEFSDTLNIKVFIFNQDCIPFWGTSPLLVDLKLMNFVYPKGFLKVCLLFI